MEGIRLAGRTFELRNLALDATLALTRDIQRAVRKDGASPRVAQARRHQRRAQFYTDFVEAENSMGFHAPQEAARVLGHAIDEARKGQAALGGQSAGPAMEAPAGVRSVGPQPRTGPGAEGAGPAQRPGGGAGAGGAGGSAASRARTSR